VQIPGLPGAGVGDEHNKSFEQSAIESFEQEKAANHGKLEPLVYVLALSGAAQREPLGPASCAAGPRTAPGLASSW